MGRIRFWRYSENSGAGPGKLRSREQIREGSRIPADALPRDYGAVGDLPICFIPVVAMGDLPGNIGKLKA